MGGVEFTAILLGLGFRFRWNYARTEKVDEINAAVDSIMRGETAVRTPDGEAQ